MKWRKTGIGELVHRGKYAGSDADLKRLAAELSGFIDLHPDLRTSDVIVGIPSHSPRQFSEHLARAVGDLRAVPVVIVEDDIEVPIKDTDPTLRPNPTFTIDPGQFAGKAVLIIDDLVRSGESARSLARAIEPARPGTVCLLAAVRTMRN